MRISLLVRNEQRIARVLSGERVRAWSGIVLLVYSVLTLVSFATALRNDGETALGTTLGADFPAMYVAGRIVHEHGAGRLYDRELHAAIVHEVLPREEPNVEIPWLYAPFFVLPFTALAHLPYAWAWLAWFSLSLGLFVAGFTMLWRALDGLPQDGYRTGLLAACSFVPFLVECLASGQTSGVSFFVLASAFLLERGGRPVWSGAVLSLLVYKPTLLLVLGPMVLLTGRWSMLAGMASGAAALMALSAATLGPDVVVAWFHRMLGYAQFSASAAPASDSGLRIWKYVDVNAFARALWGSDAVLRGLTVAVAVAAFLPLLVRAWFSHAERTRETQEADWALAVAWTPVLNLYFAMYDVSLLVMSALLVAAAQFRRGGLTIEAKVLFAAVYATAWITQPVTRATGVQLLTILLAGYGLYVWRWQREIRGEEISPPASAADLRS